MARRRACSSAGTPGAGETGSYTLALEEATGPGTGPGTGTGLVLDAPSNADLADLAEIAGCEIDALSGDGSLAGALTPADCTLANGAPVDLFAFRVSEDATIDVRMVSDAFDTYLVLLSADGELVAIDNDGGGGTTALLASAELADGLYLLGATAYLESGRGPYTLRLTSTD